MAWSKRVWRALGKAAKVRPSWLMLPRRRIASVSSRALTDLSVGTSPQMTSRILLPEPPKNSPTVPLTDTPGCLNGTILTKTAGSALNMLLALGGCNIVFSRERGGHTRRGDQGSARGIRRPPPAAGVGRGDRLRLGPRPRARRLERAGPDQGLLLRRPQGLPGPLGGPLRQDVHHRGGGAAHRYGDPLRLPQGRLRARHQDRPQRPARPGLRERGRRAPRRIRLRHLGPRERPRLHPLPQPPHAAGLREERLRERRRRHPPQPLRQPPLHRALLYPPPRKVGQTPDRAPSPQERSTAWDFCPETSRSPRRSKPERSASARSRSTTS